MPSVEFDTTENLTTLAKATLRQAVREVFGSAPVNFVRKKNALLHFGVTAPSATEMAVKGDARAVATAIRNALPKSPKTPWDGIYAPETILYLDIETHEAERMWDMPLREFFRLGQFAWGPEGDIDLTTDLDEVLDACKRANGIVAHNGHQFDFSVLFGDEALKYAQAGKLFDTMLFANLAFPAPYMFKMRPKEGGKPRTVITEGKPEMVSLWLSLDNLAYQLNVDGKEGDLKALAKEFGGFGLIPTNDPRYEDYARGDIRMLQAITTNLISMHPVSQYDRREQLKGAIAAQMSRNGFRVDISAAKARVAELAERKEVLLADLDARYGFPTEGKMPWRTNKGKEAILNALADYGITPETRPSWPQLKTGPSLGGKVLLELTEDTEAEELGITLAELQGQRSLAQQALDYVHDDSRVHPSITLWQRSGRSCLPDTHRIVTKRGILTSDQVVVGDYTLDVHNRWVKITNVLHYQDANVLRSKNKSVLIECTPEHRWVQQSGNNYFLDRVVEPLVFPSRRSLQLTPDAFPFDPKDAYLDPEMTDGERFAALVGLLVTDGTAKQRTDGTGGVFRVYQTEGKFYDLLLRVLRPEWVLRDDNRGLIGNCKTPLHEIVLVQDTKYLLENAGLSWREGLRYSDTLLPWLLSCTRSEVETFLRFAYLADGYVAVGGGVGISTINPVTARVFQLAAYRCGFRAVYRVCMNYRGERSGVVSLRRDRVSTRNLPEPETFVSDVWCVTTESGTFTAWGPDDVPYLTGNSITKPGLTTWGERNPIDKGYLVASEGHKLVEFDLSNADQRIVAALSGDTEYAKRFLPGVDGHEISGRLMFGNATYDTDPKAHRTIAKSLSHAYAYGAGSRKLAATAKQPLDLAEKFVDAMKRAYPGVIAWQNRVRAEGEKGSVRNRWGRVMQIDRDSAYTQAPAAFGQSGTAEIIWDGLIEMLERDERLIKWVVCMIHDALLFDFPEDQLDYAVPMVVECMEQNINGIEFPVGHGPAGDTWQDARHG